MGVRLGECRGAGPSQVDEVCADSERIADIRAQRANVSARFASHPEEDVPTVDLKRFELVHVPGPLLALDRRADRRDLKDLSHESTHHGSNAPLAVRAKRIAGREGTTVEEAKREIMARERSEGIRYKSIYGIDLGDTRIFDLMIDSRDRTPDEIVTLIAARVGG